MYYKLPKDINKVGEFYILKSNRGIRGVKMIEYSDKDGYITMRIEGSFSDLLGSLVKMLHVIHVKLGYQNLSAGRALEAAFKDPEFIEEIFKPDENDHEILEG